MRESLYHNVRVRPSLFATVEADGTVNGSAVAVNYNKQQFRTVLLVVTSGTLTDGTFAVTVQESANGSTGWTDVPAERLEGSLPTLEADQNNLSKEIGVIPDAAKGFLRAVVTAADITDGGSLNAVFILGSPNYTPVERA